MRLQVTVQLYGPINTKKQSKTLVKNTFIIDVGSGVKSCGLVNSIKPVNQDCVIVYIMQMQDDTFTVGQYIIPNTAALVVVEMTCAAVT